MAIVVLLIAAAVCAVPIFLTIIVSVASTREDRTWSLSAPPPGQAQALARRIVDFRSEGVWPETERHQPPTEYSAPRIPAGHR